ncbi:MAG TPA: HNH endonuclease [Alphaproteobacteria bacterium]
MSKKFRDMTCIYCLIRPSIRQGDHLFARGFFPENKRNNLPKIPGCDQCNNAKSRLEHYLASILPFGARHADALTNLETMVPSRLAKNQKLHRELNAGRETVLSEEGPGLFVETSALPFDGNSLHLLMAYVVKGLLWHHWKVVLTPEFDVRIVSITKPFEPFFAEILGQQAAQRTRENLGDGAFMYEGAQGKDYPELSVWAFSLFGGLKVAGDADAPHEGSSRIIAITARKDFLARLDALLGDQGQSRFLGQPQ